MRNGLMLLVVLVGLLLSGFYTVDERAVALVTYANNAVAKQVYTTGIHWKIPFYGKLTYVYTNLRHARLSSEQALKLANGQQFQADIDLSWQVSNPQRYLDYLTRQSLKMLNLQISTAVLKLLQDLAASSVTSQELLAKTNVASNMMPTTLERCCGLKLVRIRLTSLMALESAVTLAPRLSAESAYVLAQQIKLNSDMAYQASLAQLKRQNQEFYTYFMKINDYARTAKSKDEVPPLAQLISRN